MLKRYPIAPISDNTNNFFDTIIDDPYQWLENNNDHRTQKWIEEQKRYTDEFMSKLPNRDAIKERLNELYRYKKEGTPFVMQGVTFCFKNDGSANQDTLYTLDTTTQLWRSLFNPNDYNTDGTLAIEKLAVSEDAKMVAFTVSFGGSDWKEIWVIDIESELLIEQCIKWVKFSDIAWYENGFYYTKYPKPQDDLLTDINANSKIYYHRIGDNQADDSLVFEDHTDPEQGFNCLVSDSKNYLYINATKSTSGNALYLIPTLKNGKTTALFNNFNADREVIEEHNNMVYILTNDGAPKKKLIAINIETLTSFEIIPEGEDLIEACYAFENLFVVIRLHNASHQIHLYSKTGEHVTKIPLPNIGTVNGFIADKHSNSVYFGFTTYFQPTITYSLDLKNQKIVALSDISVNYNPNDYTTRQEWYQSKDGTKVPMFLTHKKNLDPTKPHPTLLYGYGGFDISLTPTFNPSRIYWLEQDGILAIPNLRGGGEFGSGWHIDGTKLKKQNVFDDFIAAAEYLINSNYTTNAQLVIHGGSNGGLLVGAVTNQRPDLFAVAIPSVGVMDMLRYQNFTIGYFWASDYGTSTESKEMFQYLKNYSPLHNINEQAYPAILITTAEKDDRVVPAHSFKYTATLQALKNTPICIIRIEDEAGHGAGKPIIKIVNEQTDILAFIFQHIKGLDNN